MDVFVVAVQMPSSTLWSELVQLVRSDCFQRSLELTEETFYHSIGNGVMGSCANAVANK